MIDLRLDRTFLLETLEKLLSIPSPAGHSDEIVQFVCEILGDLGIPLELTRRGAIRADLKGEVTSPDRALVAHLDTLGAMVRALKPNGRLAPWPIGHWNARFADGARVSILKEDGSTSRGTLLPLKASGHTFNEEVDQQPVCWDHMEVRVDETCFSAEDLAAAGFQIGDILAVDSSPEFLPNGFLNARHLDNKAGTAVLLAAAQALVQTQAPLAVDCHLLFTISEEVGSGASAILHGDVAEMVSIDNSTPAPGQGSIETGVTIGMMDSSGPFDHHLTHKLLELCKGLEIPHARDVFRYYRCDAASAIEAGNDIRTALACFGADGSHGWERTHVDSLLCLGRLLGAYVQSPPLFAADREALVEEREFIPDEEVDLHQQR